MCEDVLLPGKKLGDEGDGECLEGPVADHDDDDDPGEVARHQDWDGDAVEVSSSGQDELETGTCEENTNIGEEVSPVLVGSGRRRQS